MEVSRTAKILRRLALIGTGLFLTGVAVGLVAWAMFPRQVVISPPFTVQELDINALDYYDVGAVDINHDGNLDVFTTNHSSRQSLLVAAGNDGYSDQLTRFGLDQVRDLPGLEDTGAAPEMNRSGLYIYFIKSTLHFTHINHSDSQGIAGSVAVPIRVEVADQRGFQAKITLSDDQFPVATVAFSSSENGELALAVTKSTPMTVSLASDVSLDKVFVGANGVNPDEHIFELYLKDRHGIAWSDSNDDGRLDAFMSRGALFGQIANFPGELADQFFVSTSNQYNDSATELGFEKRSCPARQVAWVDANTDGRLDLYVACGRQVGGFWEYVPTRFRTNRDVAPNMLYLQTRNGDFQESAARYGLDFAVGGTFLWFDVDADGDADLLWASEQEVALYRNTKGGFEHEVLLPDSTTIQVRKLAVADFDGDGDADVFAAASLGSKLLINESGTLLAADPQDYGLPSRARTAAWVDYDNNGRVDLYTWPGGIFRGSDNGRFEETGLLRMPSPYWALIDPRALWFDYDNDGDRDVLIMQRFFPQVIQKHLPNAMPFTALLMRNDSGSGNNWFEMDLRGSVGNREALGAVVTVTTSAGRQIAEVGQSESSHYSQGHYRLYFGLGNDGEPEEIEIRWPGGDVQRVEEAVSRRIVRVEQRSAAAAYSDQQQLN